LGQAFSDFEGTQNSYTYIYYGIVCEEQRKFMTLLTSLYVITSYQQNFEEDSMEWCQGGCDKFWLFPKGCTGS